MKTPIISLFLILSLLSANLVLQAEDTGDTTRHGYFFKRPDGTFLQIEMVGVRMFFTLLDENYRPLENVFTRGIMQVDPKGKNKKRMAIQPSKDGFSLQSVQTIPKPHILEVRGRLFKGDDDQTGEPFFVLYNQHRLEEVEMKPVPEK
ncbi:MAG: hypothetical protein KJT03_03425 [Verrucomicrobiae bacterium]|nr:hypothetical protein [Verrucomicrobiae bacterium]